MVGQRKKFSPSTGFLRLANSLFKVKDKQNNDEFSLNIGRLFSDKRVKLGVIALLLFSLVLDTLVLLQ